MNQKGLAPILIVLILAALVGGYFIYQNQPKPTSPPQQAIQPSPSPADTTANWKTYTDTKLGHSFKYPPELKVKATDFGANISNYDRLLNSPEGISSREYVNIGLGIYTLPDNIDFKNWIIQETVRPLPDSTTRSSIQGDIKQYNLNGFNGYTFETVVEEIDKNIVISTNGRAAWFSLVGYQTGSSYRDNPNAEGILDQILSTFKFTQ